MYMYMYPPVSANRSRSRFVTRHNGIAGSGRALDDAQRTEGRRLFAPAFTQLLDALHSLAELPAESTSWSADQHDEYKRFRYAVGDAITDVCKVLSPTVCLERTFAQLQGVLPGLAAAPAEGWRRAECCVWCMRQMVSNGDPQFFGAEVVGQLMRLLPALPAAGERHAEAIKTLMQTAKLDVMGLTEADAKTFQKALDSGTVFAKTCVQKSSNQNNKFDCTLITKSIKTPTSYRSYRFGTTNTIVCHQNFFNDMITTTVLNK